MTVSISKIDINYYLSTIARGDEGQTSSQHLTSYYTKSGNPSGQWFGAGLKGIELTPGDQVTADQAINLFEEGRNPNTKESLGKRPIAKTAAPEDAKTASGKSAKKTREAVAGFDLSFSAPKSVSTLWAISDAATQAKIHAAHKRSVNLCLEWAENNIIQTRSGDGGLVKNETSGIIASLFDHYDSREGDPQLHTHAVIANRVQRASDGKWVTLDSYSLHKWVVTISAMYNNVLYDELAKDLGTHAEQRKPLLNSALKNDRIELAGVPDELIEEFSQRSIAIESMTNELVEQWVLNKGKRPNDSELMELRQKATLMTRKAKDDSPLPLNLKMMGWRDKALEQEFFPQDLVKRSTGHDVTFQKFSDYTPEALEEIAFEALEQTAQKHPTFTVMNLQATLHRLTAQVRFTSLDERTQAIETLQEIALEEAVAMTPHRYDITNITQDGLILRGTSVFDRDEERLYTTQYTLDTEAALMQGAQNTTGLHNQNTTLTRRTLEEHTSEDGHHLAPDQLEAAYNVLTSRAQISAISGPAGAGKTSTLAGLKAAWEAEHGQDSIIGLAPSAAAAAVLSKELGITTDNTAKFLYESIGDGAKERATRYAKTINSIKQLENAIARNPEHFISLNARLLAARTRLTTLISDQAKFQIKPGQLLIVDEASMSSSTDLYQLYEQVNRAGAKMLLVGDAKQLDAVDAGGFLGWMENNELTANLTSIWRFKAHWEKQASLELRQGEASVLDTYQANGRISEAEDHLDSAYQHWLTDRAEGKNSILIAGNNTDVNALNLRAQTERVEKGELSADKQVQLRYSKAYIGDSILARKNQRVLIDSNGDFIKNGTRMTLASISHDTITATRDDTGASITIPLDYASTNIELGYAVTVHRSQGITVDTGHVAVDPSFSREQLYVAMTRGKTNNQIHISTETHDEQAHSPDAWNLMHEMTATDTRSVLESILKKVGATTTAHETMDAEHGWAEDLGRMCSEYDYVTDLSATRRTYQWLENFQGIDPYASANIPEIQALIKAAKESTVDFNRLDPQCSIEEAIEELTRFKDTAPRQLLEPLRFGSNDEKTVLGHISAKMNERLEVIKYLNRSEPWYQELTMRYELQPRVIEQTLIWRALSHQTDEDTATGEVPESSSRRLYACFSKYEKLMEAAKEDISDEFAASVKVIDTYLTEARQLKDHDFTVTNEPAVPIPGWVEAELNHIQSQEVRSTAM